MEKYYYTIESCEYLEFSTLKEARKAFWSIMDADNIEATRLRGIRSQHCRKVIIRVSWATGKKQRFDVR